MRPRTTIGPAAIPPRAALGLAFLLAAAGCDCDDTALKKGGPVIQVVPAEVTVEGIPQRATEVALRVTNTGSGLLVLDPPPSFEESDGDQDVEFGVPETGRFRQDCDLGARDASKGLASGECALLVFRYVPARNGVDEAVLHIFSSDGEKPDFAVPVHGNSQTPEIEVCALDGQSEIGCSVDTEFDVDFGISPPGTPVHRTLKVYSKGTRALLVGRPVLSGDLDFVPDLAAFSGDSTSIAAGGERTVEVVFDALAGGPRAAVLTLPSNDPNTNPLHVNFSATGDGPRLCISAPNLDFGQVPVGGTLEKTLKLASCGTKPLDLTTLALADASGVFAATFPTLPQHMTPGSAPLEIPVRFSPPTPDRFQSRINLATDTEQGFVTLTGQGVTSGCKLEAPSTLLDFGQVQIGVQARRDYVVSNHGTKNCVVSQTPEITRGADLRFGIVSFPEGAVVAPGDVVKFTASYQPADGTGPDEGEMQIRFNEETAGAPLQSLAVRLKGTPTAEPKCVLTALPGSASAFGRSLNFGQVRMNQEKVLPVTFQNVGASDCTLQPGRIQGTALPGMPNDAPAFRVKTQPRSPLAPGSTTTVDVGFTPVSERAYGSPLPGFPGGGFGVKLSVVTGDPTSFPGTACAGFMGSGTPGCIAWDLSGEGVQGALQALPADVNFGRVTLGCRSAEQTVTLYNVGRADIQIRSFRVDPPPAAGQPEIFHVSAPATPFTIRGGGQQAITVRYRPPDSGLHTASLYIESDATNTSGGNPYITVGLRGEGTTTSHQVDVFDQSSRPRSDVLFVIDNSGSMSEEQSAIAANARTFLQTALQLNTDFQLGVVTTDMDDAADSGNLKGTPKIILPGPNAAQQFATAVRQGTNGTGTEKGLAAMTAALTPPLSADPAKNGGFLRADAKLAVIVVSDEDDQSSGTVDFYSDLLKSLKGQYNAGLVSLSAIVGDPAPNRNSAGEYGCSSSNGDAVSGDRYITVQQRTGGKFRSICSADWGQIAADLGLDAFGTRAGYPLSRVPDTSRPIVVTVNGTAVTRPNWTYDAQSNSIVFEAAALPQPNSRVVIEYDAACL